MSHDVFISYSSIDKAAADTICRDLEQRGISCWMAPRDIVPGMPWAESIVDALEASGIMVLVYSANANVSVQIHREVERAVHKNIPLLPIRIEEAVPTRSMEYFISSTHWFDAIAPPLESHMERFAKGVAALLARRSHNAPGAPPGSGHAHPAQPHTDAAAAPAPPPASHHAPPAAHSEPLAAPAAPRAPDTGIPKVLGNYDVGAFLVAGRYGSVVHAGAHRLMGNPVAIRIFRAPAKERGQAVRERFLREARSLQVQHPNIVHVRDFGEVDDVLYVVTDLLPGCSLSELLTAEGPLAAPKLLTFVKELIDATAAVHRQNGLISGLRPDMIRVVRESGGERIAISSAGINLAQELMAVMNEASLRGEAGAHLGELSYVAPELLMGKTADVRSDAFTLGVLAYQMATGKPPFHAGSMPELMGAMLMTTPADLAGIRADMPPDAAAVIMRCLKADPLQRFATAAEVFEAWQHATAG